jgi:hypothetical protein
MQFSAPAFRIPLKFLLFDGHGSCCSSSGCLFLGGGMKRFGPVLFFLLFLLLSFVAMKVASGVLFPERFSDRAATDVGVPTIAPHEKPFQKIAIKDLKRY